MNRSCSKTRHHTFASRIRKKTSQIEVKLTVWTMSGKPNGQYGTPNVLIYQLVGVSYELIYHSR